MYGFWYWLHVICAGLTVSGFVLRGLLMIIASPLREARIVRILPHVVDTLLLIAALALATLSARWPFVEPWLTAKFCALLLYIGLGLVAFRFGRSRPVRITAFVAAVGVVLYIVSVAWTRSPLPFV